MKKKILITLSIVVVLIAGAAAVLLANLNRIIESRRGEILALAHDAVGREVTVGEIGATLFPSVGVRVDNVTLADDPAFASQPFVSAEAVQVNVKILPLIRKRVEVKRLVLERPVVRIICNEEGRFNYESLIPESEGEVGSDDAAAALPLVLAFADVRDGTLEYRNDQTGITHAIRKFDFTARDVSLDTQVSMELRAAVLGEEQDVWIKGTAGPVGNISSAQQTDAVPLDIELKIGPVDAAGLAALMPKSAKPPALDLRHIGTVELEATASGTVGALEVAVTKLSASVLGASEPNVRLTLAAGPADATPPDPAALDFPLNGTIELRAIDVAGAMALAGDASALPPELKVGGAFDANLGFSKTGDAFDLSGKVDATAMSVINGTVFAKPAGMSLVADFDARATPLLPASAGMALDIGKLIVSVNQTSASITGHVSPTGRDLHVVVDEDDISSLAGLLPMMAGFSPAGALHVDARLSGTDEINGTVVLKNASATLPQLPAPVKNAGATVQFAGTSAKVRDASFTVGQSRLDAAVALSQLQPMKGDFQITSKEIHRDDFQVPPKAPPRPEVFRDVSVKGEMSATPDGAFTSTAKVTSSGGVVSNLDYTALDASIRSTDEQIVIEHFAANTLDGKVEGDGVFKAKADPPAFDLKTRVRQIDLSEYFKYQFPTLSQVIEGRIDGNVNVGGSGRTWEEISPTLSGDGDALVIRGALLNVNIADQLFNSVQSIAFVPAGFSDGVRKRNPKLFSGNETVFEDLKGTVEIQNGRVQSNNLGLHNADFDITGAGWFAFDQKVDIKATITLSPRLTQDAIAEFSAAKYLADKNGRIALPLLLSGTATKLRIDPDLQVISKRIQDALLKEGTDELGDKLGDKIKGFFKKD